ncbi:MAG: SufD family Fe-S cluster assembly protein, partial [Candidatus Methanospirareceae archaeon]
MLEVKYEGVDNSEDKDEIDIEAYRIEEEEYEPIGSLEELGEYRDELLLAGIDPQERGRAGSFLQRDHSVIFARALFPGLEVMSTGEALKKYSWLKDYYWRALPADKDVYTREVARRPMHGYFIRA